ncbi:MAG: ATPase, T2SS/T4P/T4SS family, partial [Planctomycetota bacterium]
KAAPPAKEQPKRDKWNDQHSIFRLTSLSAAWPKLLAVILVFLAWVRSGDWVSRDAQIYKLGHETWNPIVVAPFVLGFLALLLIPNFYAGIAVLVLTWIVPFGLYVGKHNSSVEGHQTVFTSSWFRFQFALLGKRLGLKVGAEKTAGYLRGPQVDLTARGGAEDRVDQANLLTARQSPGYVHVKELIADMTARGSSRAILDYGQEAVSLRHMIDGVWHNGEARDRESGDVMLAVMKQLANLNVSERKKKQQGEFGAEYEKQKYDCEIASQGVKSGERVVVSLRGKGLKSDHQTLEQLGMREKLRERWLEIMSGDRGLVVISAMPEGGLTTLVDVSLLETDRLMRDFVSIEEVSEPETDIENLEAHFYDAGKGETPAKLVPTLSRKYPNVYVCRDFVDGESAKLLLDEIDMDRMVITSVHAADTSEACLRLLKKKTPHKDFTKSVVAVLNTRLIRLLCDDCKVEYEATPELLKKLGIPQGKVTRFFRAPK